MSETGRNCDSSDFFRCTVALVCYSGLERLDRPEKKGEREIALHSLDKREAWESCH